MVDINDFEQEKTCTYKDEVYSVRDNGAIMRHIREGKPKRKNDNLWTFGKPNLISGYLEFAGERVHRIVACAFLGDPPTDQHVVDHIDTNRHNNRPDNLRWLTRLENALNNPITRAKIEMICGSIEAFIQNPSILHKYESKDTNFSWMRRVSPEEAKAAYEHWMEWANKTKEDRIPKEMEGLDPGIGYSALRRIMLRKVKIMIHPKKLKFFNIGSLKLLIEQKKVTSHYLQELQRKVKMYFKNI